MDLDPAPRPRFGDDVAVDGEHRLNLQASENLAQAFVLDDDLGFAGTVADGEERDRAKIAASGQPTLDRCRPR